ncbi:potassium transporter TrkA [Aphanothece hegewaldii CCALA 016]|uniref:Potassium transporter TrkA n=1 Tax=Aphanothece hegewaldii CCALA 016 TaxID=2107694 RepID=A0A2T1M337_9CHRO|nr:NAD(P)-binding protein [Aphanothece hegewaldii]PSF39253.1 potassium transporter TrkA [Aphanothece hegewaldii CCALA 016]
MQQLDAISPPSSSSLDYFLVCGLGSLGQHCVVALKEFNVSIIAIECSLPTSWEIPELSNLIEQLIVGDCRQKNILEKANITSCRAALLVTSSEEVNTATALVIRQLNPQTRLIVRSAKENLNELLGEHLGNFIAYEPTELPAAAFALAALGTETIGFFMLDEQRFQVIHRQIKSHDSWCYNRLLHDINNRTRRLINYTPEGQNYSNNFYKWESENTINPGDTITYLEIVEQLTFFSEPKLSKNSKTAKDSTLKIPIIKKTQNFLQHFWKLSLQQQIRRVAIFSGIIVLFLLIIGTILIHWFSPQLNLLSSLFITATLLLGGYGDIFGGFENITDVPSWLQGFGLLLSLAGTGFVGVLYALLTEALLSTKFEFIKQRPPIPQQDHIIVIGLGRIGQTVVKLLQNFNQSLVGISFNLDLEQRILPNIPLIVGKQKETLAKSNLETAKSVVIVTPDDIVNLEVALMVYQKNPNCNLVIRTSGIGLNYLTQLLPKAQVLEAYKVAAEAFAGAAFGENILYLFRLNHQTILVTEYKIEMGDTLNGLLLSEVAYGYDVIPVLHQKQNNSSHLMPSEDILLSEGDIMVILATPEGLQRVEKGKGSIKPKTWRVRVNTVYGQDAIFEGANAISRISGYPLNKTREIMTHLPTTLPPLLYKLQAQRLVRALMKAGVNAEVISI